MIPFMFCFHHNKLFVHLLQLNLSLGHDPLTQDSQTCAHSIIRIQITETRMQIIVSGILLLSIRIFPLILVRCQQQLQFNVTLQIKIANLAIANPAITNPAILVVAFT